LDAAEIAKQQNYCNQWTQFEEFSRFMEGVKEVRRLDDQRLHWRAGDKEKEWTAKIIEQVPDHRIAWKSKSDEYNSGQVDFARLGPQNRPSQVRRATLFH
jgi:uncharacterized membrane protein